MVALDDQITDLAQLAQAARGVDAVGANDHAVGLGEGVEAAQRLELGVMADLEHAHAAQILQPAQVVELGVTGNGQRAGHFVEPRQGAHVLQVGAGDREVALHGVAGGVAGGFNGAVDGTAWASHRERRNGSSLTGCAGVCGESNEGGDD